CAKRSTCARKPGSVTCCTTNAKGKTTCDIKSKAADCKAPRGGHACAGSVPSCCDACTAGGCAPPATTTTPTPPTTVPPSGGLQCACEASSDCQSEAPCCCQGLSGGNGNVCTLQQDCAAGGGTCECSAGDVRLFGGVCPGTPCSVDQQCSFVEFCT